MNPSLPKTATASVALRTDGDDSLPLDHVGAGRDDSAGVATSLRPAIPVSFPDFVHVFNECRPKVLKRCYRMLGNAHDAEDMAQDAFRTLWEQRDSIPTDRPLVAHLLGIARHKCLDLLRKRARIDFVPDFDKEHGYVLADQSDCREVDRRSRAQMVHESLRKLPRHQREATLAQYFDGFSMIEIAELAQAGVSAVGMRLKRARETMRADLARKGVTSSDC